MGVEGPPCTLLADFWSLVNEDLRFVVCLRHPLEVGLSLQRWLMSPSLGMSLWAAYYERLLETTSRSARIIVDYHALLSHPAARLPSLAGKLGVDREQQLRDSLALVDPVQRHHNAASPHSQFLPRWSRGSTRGCLRKRPIDQPSRGGTRSRLQLPPSMVRTEGRALVELSDLYQQTLAIDEDRERWRGRAGDVEQERASLTRRLEVALAAAAAAEAQREVWERATYEARTMAEQAEARVQAELQQLAEDRDRWRTRAGEYSFTLIVGAGVPETLSRSGEA